MADEIPVSSNWAYKLRKNLEAFNIIRCCFLLAFDTKGKIELIFSEVVPSKVLTIETSGLAWL